MASLEKKVKAECFPWLTGREKPTDKPLYKIVARSVAINDNSVVMLHRAGATHVENYYLKDIVNNLEIMEGLDQKERHLLEWVRNSEINDPVKTINNT